MDPNDIIDIEEDGPPSRHFGQRLTAAQRKMATNLIAALQYPDIWRASRTLHEEGKMHLDQQNANPAVQGANLQIQVGGGDSTIATALVEPRLSTAGTAELQRYVERMVRNALNQSLVSFMDRHAPRMFRVTVAPR